MRDIDSARWGKGGLRCGGLGVERVRWTTHRGRRGRSVATPLGRRRRVRAKRWKHPVGLPDAQGLYGALAGKRATKGVFITTSTFTTGAVEFANSVEKVVLVDGESLTKYMMDFGVGVSHRVMRVPKVDVDYYEE